MLTQSPKLMAQVLRRRLGDECDHDMLITGLPHAVAGFSDCRAKDYMVGNAVTNESLADRKQPWFSQLQLVVRRIAGGDHHFASMRPTNVQRRLIDDRARASRQLSIVFLKEHHIAGRRFADEGAATDQQK
jgi:hypothetical protein